MIHIPDLISRWLNDSGYYPLELSFQPTKDVPFYRCALSVTTSSGDQPEYQYGGIDTSPRMARLKAYMEFIEDLGRCRFGGNTSRGWAAHPSLYPSGKSSHEIIETLLLYQSMTQSLLTPVDKWYGSSELCAVAGWPDLSKHDLQVYTSVCSSTPFAVASLSAHGSEYFGVCASKTFLDAYSGSVMEAFQMIDAKLVAGSLVSRHELNRCCKESRVVLEPISTLVKNFQVEIGGTVFFVSSADHLGSSSVFDKALHLFVRG